MIKVAAAVIVSDGKILAAKRKNERLGGGFWEFPGGKLEPGETPKQACQREVAEELGDQCEVQVVDPRTTGKCYVAQAL